VPAESAPAAPRLFKAAFFVVVAILLAAVVYSGWIVVRYWDRVGV
jgi:hypothetical protein